MVTSIYLALEESFFIQTDQSTKAISSLAKVTNISHSVKRKYANDINWYRLTVPNAIFESDSIFTEENATAEITFNDGGKLLIDSSTMLTIKSQGSNKSLINIEKGSVTSTLTKGRKLKIKTEGQKEEEAQEFSGDNSHVQLKVADSGKTELAVLSGQIQIQKGKRQETVKENQLVKIDQKGKVEKIIDIDLKLEFPHAEALIWITGENNSITFRWNSSKPLDRYLFQLAKDNLFQQIVATSEKNDHNFLLQNITFTGKFYWRVIGYKEDQEFRSLVYGVKLLQEKPLLLVYPAHNHIFTPTFEHIKEGLAVNLRWQDSLEASNYFIQLATDEQFTKLLTNSKVKNQFARTPPLQTGDFYWRIKAEGRDRPKANWSKSSHFKITATVKAQETQSLGTVKKTKMSSPETSQESISVKGSDQSKLYLQWKSIPLADHYILQIAPGEEIKGAEIKEQFIKETFYEIKNFSPGRYSWRVAAMDAQNNIGEWSKVGHFKITPPPPLLKPPVISLEEEKIFFAEDVVKFKWGLVEFAKGYHWQVSSDEIFTLLLAEGDTKEEDLFANFVIKNGEKHHIRVQALNPPNKPGPYSSTLTFSVETTILPPKFFVKEDPIKKPEESSLYWQKIEGANEYLIQFAKDSQFKNIIKEETLRGTQINLPADEMKEDGDYYVRGKTFGKNRRSSPYSLTFTLTVIRPLSAPKILYSKKADPPYIIWEKMKNALNYQIEINVLKNGKWVVHVNNKTNSNFFKLEKYQKGEYRWRLRAIGLDRSPGEYTSVQQFTISNPKLMSICQKKMDLNSIKLFDLEKISIDQQTGCLLIDK